MPSRWLNKGTRRSVIPVERPVLGVSGLRSDFKSLDQMAHLSSQLCPRAFRAGLQGWIHHPNPEPGRRCPVQGQRGETVRGGAGTLALPIPAHLLLPGTQLPKHKPLCSLDSLFPSGFPGAACSGGLKAVSLINPLAKEILLSP